VRRVLGALLLCGLLCGGHVEAAQADSRLDRVWSFLETLPPLTARFVQQEPDGTLRKGWIAVSPPGRARIEYEPPDNTVLVANGTYLVYHNPDAGQTAHFLLDQLPLRVLFEGRRPTADDNLQILQVAERNEFLVVRIAALDDDGVQIPGWIELVFLQEPFGLAGWKLVDVQQRSTVVVLEDVAAAEFAAHDMFSLSDDMIQRGDLWRGPWAQRRVLPGNPRGIR